MKKREANFGLQFRAWMRAQKRMKSAVFELKQTMKDSIPFNALEEHQENALLAASGKEGVLYKIPDDSRSVKPFDYGFHRRVPAYIVIKYPQGFVIIPVRDFIAERERSDRRSLTWDRAKELDVKAP